MFQRLRNFTLRNFEANRLKLEFRNLEYIEEIACGLLREKKKTCQMLEIYLKDGSIVSQDLFCFLDSNEIEKLYIIFLGK